MTKRTKKRNQGLKRWLRGFFIAVVLALIVRLFFIESFAVYSGSMKSALLEDDYVFVNKIRHGARLPVTLLNIPFLHRHIPFTKIPCYVDWITLPYVRFPAISPVERGELLVFNQPTDSILPFDKKRRCVRRCIGLPGDIIEIRNKQVLINGKAGNFSSTVLYNYKMTSDLTAPKDSLFRRFGVHCYRRTPELGLFYITASPDTIAQMDSIAGIQIEIMQKDSGLYQKGCFPLPGKYYWNDDFYGRLWIPRKGKTIEFTAENIYLYRDIIEKYEKHTFDTDNNGVYINGKQQNTYTFQYDYYFVLSDNRDNFYDSRRWGFIPESHVIGTVWCIWFSYDRKKHKIRWKRVGATETGFNNK